MLIISMPPSWDDVLNQIYNDPENWQLHEQVIRDYWYLRYHPFANHFIGSKTLPNREFSTQMEQLKYRLAQPLVTPLFQQSNPFVTTKASTNSIITLFMLMADLVKTTTSKVKSIKKERALTKENERVLRDVVRKYFSIYSQQEGGRNTHDKG